MVEALISMIVYSEMRSQKMQKQSFSILLFLIFDQILTALLFLLGYLRTFGPVHNLIQ